MLWGYASSAAKGVPRYEDPAFRRFLRSYQHSCLLWGKRAATARLDARQADTWRARGHKAGLAQGHSMKQDGKAELMGLSFDRVSMDTTVEQCQEWCRGTRASHTVITANASHLCMMRRDAELQDACRSGDLVVADGMSVVWAMLALGTPVPERVAGVDLMDNLLRAAGTDKLRVYFLGARQQVVAKLAETYRERYAGLEVVGWRDGYFTPNDHEAIVEEIRVSRRTCCLLACRARSRKCGLRSTANE